MSVLRGGEQSTSSLGRSIRGKESQYMGWPQSRSGRFWRRKNLLPIPKFDPQTIQPVDSFKHTRHYLHKMGGACSAYRGEAYTGFWWGNLRERDNLGDPAIDGRITLRWIFRKWYVGVWTGWSLLRIGICGEHLWMWQWTFGFHKMRGISWLAKNRLASQEGLCSIEWVS